MSTLFTRLGLNTLCVALSKHTFTHFRFFLILALVAVMFGVFLVVSVFLLNLWAASLTVLMSAVVVFQLAGFMGSIEVHLSAAPAVLLVAAVGIGLEFTLHILLGFLTSIGSRSRRVGLAMTHMAPPVIHSAVSTILATLMLLFSEFDFIRR